MPLTKQAVKKLAHDRRRTVARAKTQTLVRNVVTAMRRHPSKKALQTAFRTIDKAAKTSVVHPNKAARLKSRLSKLLSKKSS